MLTSINYLCNEESLGDVSPSAFAEAFENEVRVKAIYRDLEVTVEFGDEASGVNYVATDDEGGEGPHDDDRIQEEFRRFADKAFAACLK